MLPFQDSPPPSPVPSGGVADPLARWDDALESALRSLPEGTRSPQLFLEDREDLRLERGLDEPATVVRNRLRGISIGESGDRNRLVHLSDPDYEDTVALIRGFRDGAWPVRALSPGGRAPVADPVRIPLEPAERLLSAAADRFSGCNASFRLRWVGFDQTVRIARPERGVLRDRRLGRRIRIEARAEGGSGIAVGETALAEDLDAERARVVALADATLERAQILRCAGNATPGSRPVVLAPGVGGIVVHELIGHALEADTAAAGSWLAELEETGAIEDLLVLDDPRRGRAAWRVDDEGEIARPTPLVQSGKVVGRLHDRATAEAAGKPTTGHGRRGSYRDPVLPRMGCTFIAPGRSQAQEATSGIDDGVYVRRMEAASVDPVSGRAVFRVTDSDRIQAGKVASPLRPHVIVVDGRSFLAGIDRIADDLRFDTCIGSCHRAGQTMAVSVGAPTIRIGLVKVVA